MSPFGRHDDPVSARALVLTPTTPPASSGAWQVTLLVELGDGRVERAGPYWFHREYAGVIRPGRWVPVRLSPDDPDGVELDLDHVPRDSEVAAVVAEALGGPVVEPAAPDDWRVLLASQYVDDLIAAGAFSAPQIEACARG
jgi:hypothetical protein